MTSLRCWGDVPNADDGTPQICMRERGHVAPCEPTRDDRDDEESDEEEAARRAAFGREGPCPAPIVIEPSALREGAKRRGKGKAQSQNPSPGTPKGEP